VNNSDLSSDRDGNSGFRSTTQRLACQRRHRFSPRTLQCRSVQAGCRAVRAFARVSGTANASGIAGGRASRERFVHNGGRRLRGAADV